MELSENLKLRLDPASSENQRDRVIPVSESRANDATGQIDEAESQMRKALGLLGESTRHRADQDRIETPARFNERFSTGSHRRRFVQDGDIPVTVVRRDQGHEVQPHRGSVPAASPTSSRLQRVEVALASEIAAREKAERSLGEALALARDLQTKIGHAELGKNEALEALRREREAVGQLRSEVAAADEQLRQTLSRLDAVQQSEVVCREQLAVEREAKTAAEQALRDVDAARQSAEHMALTLSETPAAKAKAPPAGRTPRRLRPAERVAVAVTPRVPLDDSHVAEPEPVKWWLMPKPATKRR